VVSNPTNAGDLRYASRANPPAKLRLNFGTGSRVSGAESALCAAVSMHRISRLQSSDPRVSMRALTHSHVPMAHGGYATT